MLEKPQRLGKSFRKYNYHQFDGITTNTLYTIPTHIFIQFILLSFCLVSFRFILLWINIAMSMWSCHHSLFKCQYMYITSIVFGLRIHYLSFVCLINSYSSSVQMHHCRRKKKKFVWILTSTFVSHQLKHVNERLNEWVR